MFLLEDLHGEEFLGLDVFDQDDLRVAALPQHLQHLIVLKVKLLAHNPKAIFKFTKSKSNISIVTY